MTPLTLDQIVDLALEHQHAGRFEQAVELLRRATRLAPDWPDAHNQLGIALQQLGRHAEAIEAFDRALSSNPRYAAALGNRATSLGALGRMDEAILAAQRCTRMLPDLPEAWCNLGNLLRDAGRLSESMSAYRVAIEHGPQLAVAHNSLGNALKDLGRIDEALASYRRAVEIDPGYHAAWSNLLYASHLSPALDPQTIYDQHVAWATTHADPLSLQAPRHDNDRDPDRRLRIGLVSPDLREHPVGRFILPLLREHDRQAIEVVCYADVVKPDALSEQLRSHAASWVDSRALDDAQLAGRIRDNRIDILLDLAGHTAGNRLLAFACKPAPVQATYLGYPDTTGLSAMDYRITDAIADPAGDADALCLEKLVRLPGVAWCFDPPDDSPDVAERAGDSVTFGCFNALAKINDRVLEAWSRILDRTAGARLIVKSHGAADPAVVARVGDLRIELRRPTRSHRQHLAAYNEIDIALDPFPYCGTMTTCEALWMGAPVVTLAGKTHASRVGASLLSAVGLDELVANDVDNYVARAVALASHITRRSTLRLGLRRRMRQSGLMDAPAFARSFESALRTMWRAWCSR